MSVSLIPRSNLSPAQTPFIGREAELRELAALVRQHPVVTLVGPPGMGKTRLSREWGLLEIAQDQAAEVWSCDLSLARSVTDIVGTVARVLGINISERTPLKDLADALARRDRTWLLLDNAEGATAALAEVLEACLERSSKIRFVITSRQPLGHGHGRNAQVLELASLSRSEGVALFRLRAESVRSDSASDDAALPTIEEIISRVDALPLAIELAAGRLSILSLAQVAERVAVGLEVLRSSNTGPLRHASLERAIEESWSLLDETERRLAARCSVFRGGFTLDAAQAIVALEPLDITDALDRLRECSLMRIERDDGDGILRFRLYESVRLFLTKRIEAEELASVQERHAAYYAAAADRPTTTETWLRSECDNLLAAASLALDPVNAVRAALAIDPILRARGAFESHRAMLEKALADAARTEGETLRVRVLLAQAELYYAQHDVMNAFGKVGETSAAAAAHAPRFVPAALHLTGLIVRDMGQFDHAIALWQTALAHEETAGDVATHARILRDYAYLRSDTEQLRAAATMARRSSLAKDSLIADASLGVLLAEMNRHDEAEVLLQRAVEAARGYRGADRRLMALTLSFAASAELVRGDAPLAHAWFIDAAKAHTEVGNRTFAIFAHAYIALIELETGPASSPASAVVSLREHLEDARTTGNPFLETFVLAILAIRLAAMGTIAEARQCAASALALSVPWASAVYVLFLESAGATVGLFDALTRGEREGAAHDEAARVLAAYEALEESRARGIAVGRTCELVSGLRTLRIVRERCLQRESANPASLGKVIVGPNADWFEVGGERVDLKRRLVLKQIVDILAHQRARAPGQVVRGVDIAERIWPTVQNHEALNNRLYNAIATLRQLGLRDVLVTKGDGYLVDPSYEFERQGL